MISQEQAIVSQQIRISGQEFSDRTQELTSIGEQTAIQLADSGITIRSQIEDLDLVKNKAVEMLEQVTERLQTGQLNVGQASEEVSKNLI